MQFGVIIKEGPTDWQILQQRDGTADISLGGVWHYEEEGDIYIFAALFDELDNQLLIPWTQAVRGEGNTWSLLLQGVPAGGPYRIETSLQCGDSENYLHDEDVRGDMIHHLCVGDLFVIAGQSNAVGYGKNPVFDPPELGIHMCRSSGRWDLASHPFGDSTGTTHSENMDRYNTGHSPFLAFAKLLKRRLGYPIGLLPVASGESSIRKWDPGQDGILQKCMLRVIRQNGGRVKGILWSQGCSDTDSIENARNYGVAFRRLVTDTRRELNLPELPWFTVQLNRTMQTRNAPEELDHCWGIVREAQRTAPELISGVYVIPSTDSTMSDGRHNSANGNLMLGERLGHMALEVLYAMDTRSFPPDIYKAHRSADGLQVTLHFTNIHEKIFVRASDPRTFTVTDAQGVNTVERLFGEYEDAVVLTLRRPLKGEAYVSSLWQACPPFAMPVETSLRMPYLSFYRYIIE